MTHDDELASAPWFIRHLQQYADSGNDLPETEQLGRAMTLMDHAVHMLTVFPIDVTFANDLSAAAGFARGFQQLEAAAVLLSQGFYAEVRNLLRSVYESVGLARMLANDPEAADKWIRNAHWWPDRKVRAWLEENRVVAVDAVQLYRKFYKEGSAWAHPTARSCLERFTLTAENFQLKAGSPFDLEICRQLTVEITATALFACFAFRNAAVNEDAIPPMWRKDLYELARELSGDPMTHLDRDWRAEQARHDAMISRLRAVEELEETLRAHPRSWSSLTATSEDDKPTDS